MDFIEYYLKYVKNSGLVKSSEFTEEDYHYILQRERYLASQMFKNNCPGIYGYQELNIRQLKKRQDYCLNVLKRRFEAGKSNEVLVLVTSGEEVTMLANDVQPHGTLCASVKIK